MPPVSGFVVSLIRGACDREGAGIVRLRIAVDSRGTHLTLIVGHAIAFEEPIVSGPVVHSDRRDVSWSGALVVAREIRGFGLSHVRRDVDQGCHFVSFALLE